MRLPISLESTLAEREDFGAKVGVVPVRQDEKTAIVGNKIKAAILMPVTPANPAVSGTTFPGGC